MAQRVGKKHRPIPRSAIKAQQGGDENEVEAEEEEDAGVDGAELATLGSVFECDRINI